MNQDSGAMGTRCGKDAAVFGSVRAAGFFRESLGEPRRGGFHTRFESPRSSFRPNGNITGVIHDKDPIRPTGIRIGHRVVDIINEARQFHLELGHAPRSERFSLVEVLGFVNLFLALNGDRPFAVFGVGFFNIDDKELGDITILIGQLVEGTHLVPERRSRITPEHQHDRLFTLERSQLNLFIASHRFQLEVRGV